MSPQNELQTVNNCDDILELIPDYAFGLTSDEETRLVEANLTYCPEAEIQLAEYRSLQGEMRGDVRQINPPVQLEARLMAAIAAPATPTPKVTPMAAPRRRVSLAWTAAAAALIVLLFSNIYWMARVDALSRQQDELRELLETPGVSVRATPDVSFVLSSVADLRWVRLPPSQEGTNAWAVLMWNAESEIGLLYVQNFPQLAAGRTYQLWLTRGEERLSAGTFAVDETGKGTLLFTITEAIDQYTWSRITEEPANGSPTPTGPVLVNGEL
ncbi:MAG: anti-sigma factor [Anaerolineae bacterium]